MWHALYVRDFLKKVLNSLHFVAMFVSLYDTLNFVFVCWLSVYLKFAVI